MTGIDNQLQQHKTALNDFHSKKNKTKNISIHSGLCFTVLHQQNVITGGAGSEVNRSEVFQGLVNRLLTPGRKESHHGGAKPQSYLRHLTSFP